MQWLRRFIPASNREAGPLSSPPTPAVAEKPLLIHLGFKQRWAEFGQALPSAGFGEPVLMTMTIRQRVEIQAWCRDEFGEGEFAWTMLLAVAMNDGIVEHAAIGFRDLSAAMHCRLMWSECVGSVESTATALAAIFFPN